MAIPTLSRAYLTARLLFRAFIFLLPTEVTLCLALVLTPFFNFMGDERQMQNFVNDSP